MTINIIAVGKLKENFYREAAQEYLKRLLAYAKVNCIEPDPCALGANPEAFRIKKALDTEAEKIRSHIKSGTYTFSLCVEGNEISSEKLAEKIKSLSLNGISAVNFIVGSSYGLSENIKGISDFRLSMSRMTFPHELARVMLLEQIYRAFSIINNSGYHK